MGLYIKNMEMPKEGSWTTVRIYSDGTCAVPNWQGDCTLIKGTKAVSVPPHGKLIDADAILQEATKGEEPFDWIDKNELLRLFFDAPTIIPAELPVHHGTFAATSEQEALKRIAPASESKERPAFLPQYELTPRSEEGKA